MNLSWVDYDSINDVSGVPNLYISGASAASQRVNIEKLNIKRVVSVGVYFQPVFEHVQYKIIRLEDSEDSFILPHLPEVIDWITEGLNEGGVLVHCAAGVSRSATVVTGFLMKKLNIPFKQALVHLQQTRVIVCPNLGFREQLEIFWEMKYQIDPKNKSFKRLKLMAMGKEREENGKLEKIEYGEDPEKKVMVGDVRPSTYRCKKCRKVLFDEENVIEHELGKADAFSRNSNFSRPTNPSRESCTSVFSEPMEWIQGLESLDGSITCPKCESKVGNFSWIGSQCSCGAWVSPAFVFHKSKIDQILSKN